MFLRWLQAVVFLPGTMVVVPAAILRFSASPLRNVMAEPGSMRSFSRGRQSRAGSHAPCEDNVAVCPVPRWHGGAGATTETGRSRAKAFRKRERYANDYLPCSRGLDSRYLETARPSWAPTVM
jgi:hypothetical protein